ncbi:MAG: response regulator [Alphaproteobacteria bacterium]|nr:response regulator [Alphaproteobacteria bacterium]MBU0795798.1 response regulator [Alphaproteobacteria bacterium]MBU0886660.1 response regulator [Alphaproteobacteria bacterium]MBU1814515.1 response regulator [Alphaproteobacteria bacterium]
MPSKRLLAVDDNAAMLKIIQQVASDLGFEVEALTSGMGFMKAYARLKPDVITLDVIMPDMDGIELLRWLDDVECTAAIIIVSGGNSIYMEASQKLAEARGHLRATILRKPFRLDELRASLGAAAAFTEEPTPPV